MTHNLFFFLNPITGLDRLWGFQEVEAPRFKDNRHMKVVRLSAIRTDRLSPQEIFPVLISVRGWVDRTCIVQPEGLCQWKIPMTPSGIELATFKLAAQCLNRLRHRLPPYMTPTPCTTHSIQVDLVVNHSDLKFFIFILRVLHPERWPPGWPEHVARTLCIYRIISVYFCAYFGYCYCIYIYIYVCFKDITLKITESCYDASYQHVKQHYINLSVANVTGKWTTELVDMLWWN